jgi:aryl-alcohol dehydrogenase-like predicted oxidoreductase
MHAQTIQLGHVEITRMGLGTNRLTATPDNVTFLRAAVEAGIGMVDTAHLYTGGSSEDTVGQALAPFGGTPVIATKGGFRPGEGKPDVLRAQIQNSLRLLRTSTIPLWYLHRVDPETPLETSLGVVREFVDSGQIGMVGISDVSIEQIERARAVLPIAAVQNQYHLSNRTHDQVIDYCEREHIVFVPFSPLHGEHPALRRIADAHGATESQVALAWLLHRSPAVLPIPGTLSIAHVRENLAALDIELTADEVAALST